MGDKSKLYFLVIACLAVAKAKVGDLPLTNPRPPRRKLLWPL